MTLNVLFFLFVFNAKGDSSQHELTCFFPYLTCWRGGSTPAVTACVRICVVRAVWSCNGVWDFLPPFLKKHLEGPWFIPVPHVCITDGNEEVGSFSWCFCAVIWDFLSEHFLFLNVVVKKQSKLSVVFWTVKCFLCSMLFESAPFALTAWFALVLVAHLNVNSSALG